MHGKDSLAPPPAKFNTQYAIFFDRACRSDPGTGGIGATLRERPSDIMPFDRQLEKASVPLGDSCTTDVAGYMALIHILGRLLGHFSFEDTDSERNSDDLSDTLFADLPQQPEDPTVSIRSMINNVAPRDSRLRMYYAAASGLAERFKGVEYKAVPRCDNEVAGHLARKAIDLEVGSRHLKTFRPNPRALARILVNVQELHGTTDVGMQVQSKERTHTIDAHLLRTLDDYGMDSLRDSRFTPTQRARCQGRAFDYTVIGYVEFHAVEYVFTTPGARRTRGFRFAVVDGLPVPFHLAECHDDDETNFNNSQRPTPSKYPVEYRSHPFFNSFPSESARGTKS